MRTKLFLFLILIGFIACQPKPISTAEWQYIQIDDQKVKWGDFAEPDWLRYFGLDAADFNGDGFIVKIHQTCPFGSISYL